jgi:dienelactone hydrolase
MVRRIVLASLLASSVTVGCIGSAESPDAQPSDVVASEESAVLHFVNAARLVARVGEDEADVYYPDPPDLADGGYSFPVALMLQGAKVDKGEYSAFASRVAQYGFVVVVPNHARRLFLDRDFYPEEKQIPGTIEFVKRENEDPHSPLRGAIDTGKLALLGHSFGGAAGLYALGNKCSFPFCHGGFTRPPELKAAALFGTNNKVRFLGVSGVDNDGVALALVQGSLDGMALPRDGAATYDRVKNTPKALITVEGANHYGITNTLAPRGAAADPSRSTLDSATANEVIARWSALFLRAHMLGDPGALEYVHSSGDGHDPIVTVRSAR